MARDILVIVEGRIATVQLIEQVLDRLQATTDVTWRTRIDVDVTPEDVGPDTIPLFVRSSAYRAGRLARVFGKYGTGYAMYVDDNFWVMDQSTELGRYYAQRSVRRTLNRIARGARVVITSTPALREYLLPLNAHTIHLDAAIDFDRFSAAPPKAKPGGRLRMGFAGNVLRGVDLAPLMEVVVAALDRYPHLEFEVIGPRESAPDHPRIRAFPYLETYDEYVTFQREREWDIGLAPLGGAESNHYKTDVKYREYAAQHIAGIYQRAMPYEHIVHGATGLVAGSVDEWRAAIDGYVTDPDLLSSVKVAARADVERRYSFESITPQWLLRFDQLKPVATNPDQLAAVRRAMGKPDPLYSRMVWRARLLWLYGVAHLREHGVLHTAARAVRFVARRPFRR